MNDQEFVSRFANLPPLGYDEAPDWTWKRHRLSMRNHVLANHDDPREFTRWSTVYATMFAGETPLSSKFMHALHQENDFDARWRYAITESEVGHPERMNRFPYTSGNIVRQAYDLLQFEKETGVKAETLQTIVEFGGGYGAMSAIIRRLGFKGEYWMYDLPEFLILQEYYLSNLGFEMKPLAVDGMSRFAVPPDDVDLLIACYSLSEVEPTLRDTLFYVVKPKYALFAIQDVYGEYDIHNEFMNMAVRHGEYVWTFKEQAFRDGFYHVFAVRKEDR